MPRGLFLRRFGLFPAVLRLLTSFALISIDLASRTPTGLFVIQAKDCFFSAVVNRWDSPIRKAPGATQVLPQARKPVLNKRRKALLQLLPMLLLLLLPQVLPRRAEDMRYSPLPIQKRKRRELLPAGVVITGGPSTKRAAPDPNVFSSYHRRWDTGSHWSIRRDSMLVK